MTEPKLLEGWTNMNTYKINENMSLIIEDTAMNKLLRYCQTGNRKEKGGILLGRILADYSQFFICDISEPCDKDKSGRCFFTRDKSNAQRIVNKNWIDSSGVINYLGEWHTHPEISPQPSFVDKKLIYDCLHKNDNTFDDLFLIIVGITGQLYVGHQNRQQNGLHQVFDL